MRGTANRRLRAAALAVLGALAACGGASPSSRPPRPRSHPAATRTPSPQAWRVTAKLATRLPAPSQLPGLAAIGSTVIATGGLDAADASVASIVRVAPGSPARIGALPQASHD